MQPEEVVRQLPFAPTLIRLLAAWILGMLLGLERSRRGHPAGIRTHAVVTAGSALFSLLSVSVVAPGADPGRIASGIATGIGFLGAGTIMRYGSSVHGLTTAASIWTAAAIGMACGLGAFIPAFTAAGLVLLTLGLLRPIAHAVRPRKGEVLISVTGSVAGDLLGEIVRKVRDTGGVVTAFEMAQEEDDHQVVLVRIRLPNATTTEDIIAAIAAMEGVRGAEAV